MNNVRRLFAVSSGFGAALQARPFNVRTKPVRVGGMGTPRIDWISGFSEWHSQDLRPVSIGWDWSVFVDESNGLALERVGPLGSNVMLVDGHGRDYGWLESIEVLGAVVEALPWRELVFSMKWW